MVEYYEILLNLTDLLTKSQHPVPDAVSGGRAGGSAKRIVDADIAAAISERRIFPCLFGSALKTDGVSDFIACLSLYSRERKFKKDFAARVYKITYDPHILCRSCSTSPSMTAA